MLLAILGVRWHDDRWRHGCIRTCRSLLTLGFATQTWLLYNIEPIYIWLIKMATEHHLNPVQMGKSRPDWMAADVRNLFYYTLKQTNALHWTWVFVKCIYFNVAFSFPRPVRALRELRMRVLEFSSLYSSCIWKGLVVWTQACILHMGNHHYRDHQQW